jgi:hypothetical protein
MRPDGWQLPEGIECWLIEGTCFPSGRKRSRAYEARFSEPDFCKWLHLIHVGSERFVRVFRSNEK